MRRLPVLLTLALAASTAPLAAQVTTTLTLTSGQNAITASAVISGISSAAQAAGANVTQWTGTITVQVDNPFNPTTLTIISANLVAQDSGTWQPGLNGAAGSAPGNYGLVFATGAAGNVFAAVRSASASLSSTPLTLSGVGGSYSFLPGGASLNPTGGAVDYRNAILGNGRTNPSSAPAADNSATPGALNITGSTVSFQIPLDVSIPVTVGTAGSGTIRLVGTLNATGAIPEPSTWALAAAGLSGLVVAGMRRR